MMDLATSSPPIYPSAPWSLRGKGIVSLQLVDVEHIRPLIPAALDIIQVLPGKTIGGIYLSSYEQGSVLNYHELIVFSALNRIGDRIGTWVTHIYVDNPTSVTGGKEIWGLPKQMADFHWTEGTRPQVSVQQDNQLLCRLTYGWQMPGMRISLPPFFNTFSSVDSNLVWFSTEGEAVPQLLMDVSLEIPQSSPFSALKLDHPMLAVSLKDFLLHIHSPHQHTASVSRVTP